MVSIGNASARARGAATQTRILERAVHIASVEGLGSMSLATLAKATSMSKSGLFAHFRSKEALQIAIIDEAERIFLDMVVRPAQGTPAGARRLAALLTAYLDYCADGPFDGGCFFAAAVHEFDGRPGPVRDRLSSFFDTWNSHVRAAAKEAQLAGELSGAVDVEDVVFEVNGLGFTANFNAQLYGDKASCRARGRRCIDALVRRFSAA